MSDKLNAKDNPLGQDLKPGDAHYRAFIGPPEDYDLVSAMVFNLLTCIGLRQHHKVLDVGCGSLRYGRLLIPYLSKGGYHGVEPNEWLVNEGIRNELGNDIIRLKEPKFSFRADLSEFPESLQIDFAVAQSIFSHTGEGMLKEWLDQIKFHLADTGVLLATFIIGDQEEEAKGWIYPGCVKFKPWAIKQTALEYGLTMKMLNWKHPRQSWIALAREKFDWSLIGDKGNIGWNAVVRKKASDKMKSLKL